MGVIKVALSGPVSEINAFLCFTQKFKIAAKMTGKKIFGQNCQMTVDTQRLKYFVEIALSHIIYEILNFFCQEKLWHLVNC